MTASDPKPLAWHRKSRLINQRDLSAMIGNHDNGATIHVIEAGKSIPSLTTMRRICAALELDWRDVSEFVDSMERKGVVVRDA